jgi:small subunit ribosomal protein S18
MKKRKRCPVAASGIKPEEINYKDTELLRNFITERGKIIPRRITGVSSAVQKALAETIKIARYMALLPFVARD